MPVRYNPNTVTDSIAFALDPSNDRCFQKANLLSVSNQFDYSAYWPTQDAGSLTRTANVGVSPIGDSTADRLDVTASGQEFGVYQDIPSYGGVPIKFSFYFKNISLSTEEPTFGGTLRLSISTLGGTSGRSHVTYLDASTGEIVSGTSGTFINEVKTYSVGNGWYRVVAYYKAGDSGDATIRYMIRFSQGETGSAYLWGAQAAFDWASESYIETQTAPVIPGTTNEFLVTAGSATTSEINVGGEPYFLHVFDTGSNQVYVPKAANIETLIVGGGGAGGGTFNSSGGGGGGGAGGFREITFNNVGPATIDVLVGAGGKGANGAGSAGTGGDGGDSSFLGNVAFGGGGGGNGDDSNVQSGRPGGSGGGSGGGDVVPPATPAAGASGQGNSGGVTTHTLGDYGSGGGGANAVGESETVEGGTPDGRAGQGGSGRTSSITGTTITYAGGGGGGSNGYGGAIEGIGGSGGGGNGGLNGSPNPTQGTDGLGGGGGGAGGSGGTRTGADGGDGTVIVRYKKEFLGKVNSFIPSSSTLSPVGTCSLTRRDGIPVYETYGTAITDQSYVSFDESLVFDDGTAYSFNFWVKLRSDAQATHNSLCGALGTGRWANLYLNDTSGDDWIVRYRDADGVYRNFTQNLPAINVKNSWINICYTIDTSRDVNLYINGNFTETIASTNTQFTVRAICGGYASGGNYFPLQGAMGLASFYGKSLTADEVAQNFYVIKGRFGL